jgi:hypothetical protein
LRQRYYDPATGRFNRLDPFFGNFDDPQSLHKYLYTCEDPINQIDPTGLFGMGLGLGGLMLGAVLNTSFQTYAIDGYQDAHDGIVHGLGFFDSFYNLKILDALAAVYPENTDIVDIIAAFPVVIAFQMSGEKIKLSELMGHDAVKQLRIKYKHLP